MSAEGTHTGPSRWVGAFCCYRVDELIGQAAAQIEARE